MRRLVFICTLSFVVLCGLAARTAAQEKGQELTEEELRKAVEGLKAVRGLEGLKALGELKGVYGIEGLEALEGFKALEAFGELDLSSLDVAEEYLDILEQCRDMIEDYEAYLEEVDEESRKDHEVPVDRIRRRLDDNTYTSDPQKLISDLTEAINDIKEIEKIHKARENSNNPRCCRVIRNLRREMVIMVDLVEDYNDQHVETVLSREEVKEYMAEAIQAYVEALRAREEVRRGEEEAEKNTYVVVPPAPRVPAPPSPPIIFPEWSQYKKGTRDEVGLIRRFEDSLRVSSSSPVYISNSAGGIQVTGWDEDYIAAALGVEVASDTRTKEKEFVDQTRLAMSTGRNAHRVEAKFPELTDPETKIIRCLLLVNLPSSLHVETDNSFGDVLVSELTGGVIVTSRHSSVSLDEIKGTVEVNNTMGKISIVDVKGQVTARTSYSPIVLTGCDGSIEVENAYSEISLTDTRGPARVKNSGKVSVRDHQGELTINNTYGRVQVYDVDGEVTVSNAYQPIEVASINGRVDLENLFSQIVISDVSGGVEARNSHGQIQAEDLRGPVVLDNKNGSVTLMVDRPMRGESSVTNSHGTVNLIVHGDTDLKILASVIDGQITSPITFQADKRGNTTEAEWTLGKGSDLLRIIGNSSNLIVRDY